MIGFETLNAATTLVRMLLESHENDIAELSGPAPLSLNKIADVSRGPLE